MILWDLLALSIASGRYDARDREGVRRIAAALAVPWNRVTAAEDSLAEELRRELRGVRRVPHQPPDAGGKSPPLHLRAALFWRLPAASQLPQSAVSSVRSSWS
jgi:hypothetical protein